jgi:hypothetical protein
MTTRVIWSPGPSGTTQYNVFSGSTSTGTFYALSIVSATYTSDVYDSASNLYFYDDLNGTSNSWYSVTASNGTTSLGNSYPFQIGLSAAPTGSSGRYITKSHTFTLEEAELSDGAALMPQMNDSMWLYPSLPKRITAAIDYKSKVLSLNPSGYWPLTGTEIVSGSNVYIDLANSNHFTGARNSGIGAFIYNDVGDDNHRSYEAVTPAQFLSCSVTTSHHAFNNTFFAVSMWIKFPWGVPSVAFCIIGTQNNISTNDGWSVVTTTNGGILVRSKYGVYSAGATMGNASSNKYAVSKLFDGKHHFFAVIFNGVTLSLIIDDNKYDYSVPTPPPNLAMSSFPLRLFQAGALIAGVQAQHVCVWGGTSSIATYDITRLFQLYAEELPRIKFTLPVSSVDRVVNNIHFAGDFMRSFYMSEQSYNNTTAYPFERCDFKFAGDVTKHSDSKFDYHKIIDRINTSGSLSSSIFEQQSDCIYISDSKILIPTTSIVSINNTTAIWNHIPVTLTSSDNWQTYTTIQHTNAYGLGNVTHYMRLFNTAKTSYVSGSTILFYADGLPGNLIISNDAGQTLSDISPDFQNDEVGGPTQITFNKVYNDTVYAIGCSGTVTKLITMNLSGSVLSRTTLPITQSTSFPSPAYINGGHIVLNFNSECVYSFDSGTTFNKSNVDFSEGGNSGAYDFEYTAGIFTVFNGTTGSYSSLDGGVTWQKSNKGLQGSSTQISSQSGSNIAVVQTDATNYYDAILLYISRDFGVTYKQIKAIKGYGDPFYLKFLGDVVVIGCYGVGKKPYSTATGNSVSWPCVYMLYDISTEEVRVISSDDYQSAGYSQIAVTGSSATIIFTDTYSAVHIKKTSNMFSLTTLPHLTMKDDVSIKVPANNELYINATLDPKYPQLTPHLTSGPTVYWTEELPITVAAPSGGALFDPVPPPPHAWATPG